MSKAKISRASCATAVALTMMSTAKAATAAATNNSRKLQGNKNIEVGDSESETDPEEEMLTSSSGCSKPPKKRIRKAVSWDGLHNGNEHRPVSTNSSSSSSTSVAAVAAIDELHCPDSQVEVASRAPQGSGVTENSDSEDQLPPHDAWRNGKKDSIFRRDASPTEKLSTEDTRNSSLLAEGDACNVQYRCGRPLSPSHCHHDDDDFTKWEVGERYQMTRMLGRGSFGEVAQARDLFSCGEFVAIKRIPAAFENEEDSLRIFREMSLLRQLHGHQCIIHLKDVVQPKSFEDFKDLYLGDFSFFSLFWTSLSLSLLDQLNSSSCSNM